MKLPRAVAAVMLGSVSAAAQTPPRFEVREDLRMGSTKEAALKFGAVRDIRPMTGGRIAFAAAVVPGPSWRVQVADSTGRIIWAQRFSTRDVPTGLAVSGDTVFVLNGQYDEAVISVYIVGRSGPVRQINAPTAERGQAQQLLGSLSGTPILLTNITGDPDGNLIAPRMTPSHELRVANVSRLAGAFATVVDSTPRIISADGPNTVKVTTTLPWAPRPVFAAGAGQVYIARDGRYDIEVWTTSGKPSRRVGNAARPSAITPGEVDAWLEEWRGNRGRSWVFGDSGVAKLRQLPSVPHRPMISRMLVSATGEIAVIRADKTPSPLRRGDSTFVDVIAADGTLRGTIVLPSSVTLDAFTGTHLYAFCRDSTQVVDPSTSEPALRSLTQLVRFRLVRPSAQ